MRGYSSSNYHKERVNINTYILKNSLREIQRPVVELPKKIYLLYGVLYLSILPSNTNYRAEHMITTTTPSYLDSKIPEARIQILVVAGVGLGVTPTPPSFWIYVCQEMYSLTRSVSFVLFLKTINKFLVIWMVLYYCFTQNA